MSYSGNIIRDLDIARPDGGSEHISIVDDAIKEIKRAIVNDKKVTSVSSNYTIQATDSLIVCTGTITITLPKQNTVSTTSVFKEYTIINNGSGTVTLNAAINDSVPVTSLGANSVITLIGNGGTAWIEKKAFSSGGGGGGGLVGGAISSIEHRTSSFTLTNDDKGKVITTAGSFTISIAALSTLDANWYCWIKTIGTGSVTIDPNGSERIYMPAASHSGDTTIVLPYISNLELPLNINGILLSVNANKTAFLAVATNETHGRLGTTDNYTFVVPHGVYLVTLDITGGGGGGGGGSTYRAGGGGGAGHSARYARCHVTPGQIIPITVGSGGAGGAANQDGASGGTTSFGSYFSCPGGGGGRSGYNGGTGGSAGQEGGASGSDGEWDNVGGKGGDGGGNIWGSGGKGGYGNGKSASQWGAGGGGGGVGSFSGGNGSNGFCLVIW